jgi:hypothetical protein
MAFSATVQNIQYIGPAKRQLSGTWSGNAGDAAGSFAVSGTVVSARFEKFDSDNSWAGVVRCQNAQPVNGITTLTINNQDNVVVGYFTLDVLGS